MPSAPVKTGEGPAAAQQQASVGGSRLPESVANGSRSRPAKAQWRLKSEAKASAGSGSHVLVFERRTDNSGKEAVPEGKQEDSSVVSSGKEAVTRGNGKQEDSSIATPEREPERKGRPTPFKKQKGGGKRGGDQELLNAIVDMAARTKAAEDHLKEVKQRTWAEKELAAAKPEEKLGSKEPKVYAAKKDLADFRLSFREMHYDTKMNWKKLGLIVLFYLSTVLTVDSVSLVSGQTPKEIVFWFLRNVIISPISFIMYLNLLFLWCAFHLKLEIWWYRSAGPYLALSEDDLRPDVSRLKDLRYSDPKIRPIRERSLVIEFGGERWFPYFWYHSKKLFVSMELLTQITPKNLSLLSDAKTVARNLEYSADSFQTVMVDRYLMVDGRPLFVVNDTKVLAFALWRKSRIRSQFSVFPLGQQVANP